MEIRIRAGSSGDRTHEVMCRGRKLPQVHIYMDGPRETGPNGVEAWVVGCQECQQGQDCFCPCDDMD